VNSRPGRGSRFSVTVPLAAQPRFVAETLAPTSPLADPAHGKRVMVIDDDTLVLDGMRGILHGWGCVVETAASGEAALARLSEDGVQPDLIISDSRLADGETGIDAIARLREASAAGFPLLHKPVSPMALRTTLKRLLKAHDAPSLQAS
jgi:two-component system, sensor histidine kinase